MRTFAPQQKPAPDAKSTDPAKSHGALSEQGREVSHNSRTLQRAVGNRAVEPPRHAQQSAGSSSLSASTRFAHDFSRIRAQAQAPIVIHAHPQPPVASHDQKADRPAEHEDEAYEQFLPVQKKSLAVSNPTDADEREADEVARRVVAGQTAEIRGTSETVNRKGVGSFETTPQFQSKLESSKGSGWPLDDSTRSEMELRMGANFNKVKVHTGSEAHNLSESISAKAFTHGQHVFFRRGEYNPHSRQGKELLAHELTHTLQQAGKVRAMIQRRADSKDAQGDYVVKGKDAAKHKGSAPYAVEAGTVAQGTVVTILEKSSDGSYANVQLDDQSNTWLAMSDLQAVNKVTDGIQYTVSYNDVFVYKDPIGVSKGNKNSISYSKKKKTENKKEVNETVAESLKVNIVHRYGKFAHIKSVNSPQTDYGWIYEADVLSQTKVDRKTYLVDYKTWLEARLAEVKKLEPKQMIERAKALLGEIEKTCVAVNAVPPSYPKVVEMSTAPTFSEGTGRSFVPPELIGIARQFIEILERTAPTPKDAKNAATTSAASIAGGSLYDDTDWNKRLGVPQYRTQSDNLLSPEATCMPTSLTMILERLGFNRQDIIAASDVKLKACGKTFEEKAKDYFDTEDKVFKAKENNAKRKKMLDENAPVEKDNLERVKKGLEPLALPHPTDKIPAKMDIPSQPNEGKNYQRLRGGPSGGMIGKEDELSKEFRAQGQAEDLLGFLGFLSGYDERQKIGLSTINTIATESKLKYTMETIDWSGEARGKMKETLDAGGAILLGVSHKSGTAGGHVITVQQVTDKGLIVDDPYGGGNTEYRWTTRGSDLYAPTGKSARSAAYKNQPRFTPKSKIVEQDFWSGPGQNLEAGESLGNSKFLPYEMLDNDETFINYIKLFKRPQQK